MSETEFSRPVRLDTIGAAPRTESIEADAAERAALARRFGLLALDALTAEMTLIREGDAVRATGGIRARATQACVASGAPVPAAIDERIALIFRPARSGGPDEEIELEEAELDVVFHDGAVVDIGEAVAQSLMLALDPYPRAPDAEAALRQAGVRSEAEAGPFGALAGLRDKLKS